MARKSKKESKRERREREAADHEAAQRETRRRQRTRRWIAAAIPAVTLVAALATWGVSGDAHIAALVGLLGIGLWVPILLGLVGATIAPRDRNSAGSIDFGNRR